MAHLFYSFRNLSRAFIYGYTFIKKKIHPSIHRFINLLIHTFRLGENTLRHRDVCHGSEHAGQDGCLRFPEKA